jgi:hypothetical protein
MFQSFGVIPGIGLPIFLGVTAWMLLSFVVAIREALDYASFKKALAVCVLGWVIPSVVLWICMGRWLTASTTPFAQHSDSAVQT